MLTPFTAAGEVDWTAYRALLRFYLDSGVGGLFAVCHSSEMDYLSEPEILRLVKEAVELAAGRVPVVASLGKCDSLAAYEARARRVAALGVDAVVFTCSTLVSEDESDDVMAERTLAMAAVLPVPVGLYEAPLPYHRLLADEAFARLAHSGQVTFFKDTCCDAERVARRVLLSEETPLAIFNAHMPSLLSTLEHGVAGYCGIGSNFFPELYSWLCAGYAADPVRAQRVLDFIMSHEPPLIEGDAYPSTAKHYLALRGVPLELHARKRCADVLAPGLKERQLPSVRELETFMRELGPVPGVVATPRHEVPVELPSS